MATIAKDIKPSHALDSLLEENLDKILTCVHCGLCLPACPTYRQLGNENDSPRGRIYLMRGVVEGRLQLGEAFTNHIDLCLGCRACESVCPSGVPYGHLLEAARVEVSKSKLARGKSTEVFLRFVLDKVFTRPRLLAAVFALVRMFRDSGLASLAFKSNLIRGRLRFATALLLSSRSPVGRTRPRVRAQREDGVKAARVSILTGCVMEGLFRETNRATERVLARNGCELVEAPGQSCCGALHAHAGQLETARELARRNIEAFAGNGADRIIVNAAGCGAAMKEYRELLADDPAFAERALDFSARVRDVSEFLIEIGIRKPSEPTNRVVAYDAPCHLIHAQRIAQAPVELLRAIPGITLVPLRGFDSCCGGAGIYNLQHAELSSEILNDKIASIKESGADTAATANPGCIMQLGAGVLLSGLKVDVVHPIDLLDAAYND
jgi:glycolate oxidase iron-sulfur subunit